MQDGTLEPLVHHAVRTVGDAAAVRLVCRAWRETTDRMLSAVPTRHKQRLLRIVAVGAPLVGFAALTDGWTRIGRRPGVVLHAALRAGRVDAADWLVAKFDLGPSVVRRHQWRALGWHRRLRGVVEFVGCAALEWIRRAFGLTLADVRSARMLEWALDACEYDAASWLVREYALTPLDVCRCGRRPLQPIQHAWSTDRLCRSYSLERDEWLERTFGIPTDEPLRPSDDRLALWWWLAHLQPAHNDRAAAAVAWLATELLPRDRPLVEWLVTGEPTADVDDLQARDVLFGVGVGHHSDERLGSWLLELPDGYFFQAACRFCGGVCCYAPDLMHHLAVCNGFLRQCSPDVSGQDFQPFQF